MLAAIVVIWIWWRDTELRLFTRPRSQPAVLLMTPYMMDYDLVILALPIAWIALEGARSGFMPWEKSLLALAWLLPLFARSLGPATR